MCPQGRPRGQGRPQGLHLCCLNKSVFSYCLKLLKYSFSYSYKLQVFVLPSEAIIFVDLKLVDLRKTLRRNKCHMQGGPQKNRAVLRSHISHR